MDALRELVNCGLWETESTLNCTNFARIAHRSTRTPGTDRDGRRSFRKTTAKSFYDGPRYNGSQWMKGGLGWRGRNGCAKRVYSERFLLQVARSFSYSNFDFQLLEFPASKAEFRIPTTTTIPWQSGNRFGTCLMCPTSTFTCTSQTEREKEKETGVKLKARRKFIIWQRSLSRAIHFFSRADWLLMPPATDHWWKCKYNQRRRLFSFFKKNSFRK